MPATFPSHLAAVLPLKLWRPRWFDGVALVVGSMAPDLAYALDGTWFERPFPRLPALYNLAHSMPWFLAWALPVAFVLCPLIRRSAPAVADHLPSPLRGYAAVRHGPRWHITATSAAIGGASHILWDWFAFGPLDLASSLLGSVFALWLLLHFPRHHRPAPPAPAISPADSVSSSGSASPSGSVSPDGPVSSAGSASPARRPVVFWGTATVVLASGGALLPFLPGYFLAHTMSARVILLAIAALLIAAAATRSRPLRRDPLQQ